MIFSNFNDLNCEKNILSLPHFLSHFVNSRQTTLLWTALQCGLLYSPTHHLTWKLLPSSFMQFSILPISKNCLIKRILIQKPMHLKNSTAAPSRAEVCADTGCKPCIPLLSQRSFSPNYEQSFLGNSALFENTTLFVTHEDLCTDSRAKLEILQKTRLWQGKSNSPCAYFLCFSEEWECKKTTVIFN